jgi:hypothetical protein
MDRNPTDTGPDNRMPSRGRGRSLVAALAVAVGLAAVPAGVALAGGADGSDGSGGSAGGAANSAGQRGGGDRGDCPERDRQGGQDNQDWSQI